MAGKPILNFVIDKDLLKAIDDYRFIERFDTRAEAVRELLKFALVAKGIINPD